MADELLGNDSRSRIKRCSRCGQDKPLEEFRAQQGKRTVQSWCRPCKQAYNREWYQRNRYRHSQAVEQRRRDRAQENRQILAMAKSVPCADCGRQYPPYVMDFDHGDADKVALPSTVVRTWPAERLRTEIRKCDVVCANCHRERTFGPDGDHRRRAEH